MLAAAGEENLQEEKKNGLLRPLRIKRSFYIVAGGGIEGGEKKRKQQLIRRKKREKLNGGGGERLPLLRSPKESASILCCVRWVGRADRKIKPGKRIRCEKGELLRRREKESLSRSTLEKRQIFFGRDHHQSVGRPGGEGVLGGGGNAHRHPSQMREKKRKKKKKTSSMPCGKKKGSSEKRTREKKEFEKDKGENEAGHCKT